MKVILTAEEMDKFRNPAIEEIDYSPEFDVSLFSINVLPMVETLKKHNLKTTHKLSYITSKDFPTPIDFLKNPATATINPATATWEIWQGEVTQ